LKGKKKEKFTRLSRVKN